MSKKGQIKKRPIHIRYSENFKHQVVGEIERGELTLGQARIKYGIKGGATIQGWIKSLGKNDLLSKKIRIEMPDEISKIKLLEDRILELEKGLAQTQLENIANQSYLEQACQELNVEVAAFKKKHG